MKIRKFLFASILIASAFLLYTSCRKEASGSANNQQRVRVRLADDPAINFSAVNVDIQRVEVLVMPDSCRDRDDSDDHDEHHGNQVEDDDHGDHHCAVWDTLDIRPGVYNLLNLANGTDTILASGLTVNGKIQKIRLTLGTQNSVTIDSVSYPLAIWNSNHQVIIKVRGEDVDQVTPGDLQLWLDFDAGRSVVQVSQNHFVLKPYLRTWRPSNSAAIRGRIVPGSARAVVSAISSGDTLIAIPDRGNGQFKIRGLRGSTATVFVNATANGYRDTTITAVSLTAGRETDIGTVQLHQ
jgi:hypothetical protein